MYHYTDVQFWSYHQMLNSVCNFTSKKDQVVILGKERGTRGPLSQDLNKLVTCSCSVLFLLVVLFVHSMLDTVKHQQRFAERNLFVLNQQKRPRHVASVDKSKRNKKKPDEGRKKKEVGGSKIQFDWLTISWHFTSSRRFERTFWKLIRPAPSCKHSKILMAKTVESVISSWWVCCSKFRSFLALFLAFSFTTATWQRPQLTVENFGDFRYWSCSSRWLISRV